jgi:hypothetical protein
VHLVAVHENGKRELASRAFGKADVVEVRVREDERGDPVRVRILHAVDAGGDVSREH